MRHRQMLTATMLGCLALCWGNARAGEKLSADDSPGDNVQVKIYTAYNLWYEKPQKMFAINYQRGAMIPAGTEVTDVRVKQSTRKPTIKFKTASNGISFKIYMRPKFFPGVTIDEVKQRLFTDKPFEAQTAELKPLEIEAIRKGRLVDGMCRAAVLKARGYPPTHRTPTLEADAWLYWENRFVKEIVRFGTDGRTIAD